MLNAVAVRIAMRKEGICVTVQKNVGMRKLPDAEELACISSLCTLYPCILQYSLFESRKYLSESFARTRYHTAVAREFLGPRNDLYHLVPARTIFINVNHAAGMKNISLSVVPIIPVYERRIPVHTDETLTSYTSKHVVVIQCVIILIRASNTRVCV